MLLLWEEGLFEIFNIGSEIFIAEWSDGYINLVLDLQCLLNFSFPFNLSTKYSAIFGRSDIVLTLTGSHNFLYLINFS